MSLKATILIDNIAAEPLVSEWGLAIYIEHNGHKLLLDSGSTGIFVQNAEHLGIDLSAVECAVLSHAHYDHSDGFPSFFGVNSTAPLYLRSSASENCHSGEGAERHYIGLKQGFLTEYADRVRFADGLCQLWEGAYLVPHYSDLSELGGAAHLYTLGNDGEYRPDSLSHEQSLVFETEKGLVVFNSCCHGGGGFIVGEAVQALGQIVYALVGGLHLFRSDDNAVKAAAERLRPVQRIYTGHCTGDRGFEILKATLGDKVTQLYTGLEIEF